MRRSVVASFAVALFLMTGARVLTSQQVAVAGAQVQAAGDLCGHRMISDSAPQTFDNSIACDNDGFQAYYRAVSDWANLLYANFTNRVAPDAEQRAREACIGLGLGGGNLLSAFGNATPGCSGAPVNQDSPQSH